MCIFLKTSDDGMMETSGNREVPSKSNSSSFEIQEENTSEAYSQRSIELDENNDNQVFESFEYFRTYIHRSTMKESRKECQSKSRKTKIDTTIMKTNRDITTVNVRTVVTTCGNTITTRREIGRLVEQTTIMTSTTILKTRQIKTIEDIASGATRTSSGSSRSCTIRSNTSSTVYVCRF